MNGLEEIWPAEKLGVLMWSSLVPGSGLGWLLTFSAYAHQYTPELTFTRIAIQILGYGSFTVNQFERIHRRNDLYVIDVRHNTWKV